LSANPEGSRARLSDIIREDSRLGLSKVIV
jgi:hypothetical protein